MTGVAAAALAAPGAADAAFTSPRCGGAPVAGAGASFQNPAHLAWSSNLLFRSGAFCGSSAPVVSYQSVGSGAGRASVGSHEVGNSAGQRDYAAPGTSPGVRFGASDAGPGAAQRAQIEQGLATTTADDAVLHEIPLTIGAVTVTVNFPDGCTVPTGSPQFDQPSAGATDHTGRFWADNEKIARAFGGDSSVDTWGELLGSGNIVASAGSSETTASCEARSIVRVVRADSSGTSVVFQTWLQSIKGTYAADFPPVGSGNQRWPNDPGNTTTETDTFKRGPQNAGVASKVQSNDASIGYVELADARGNGFDKTPSASATDDIDTALGGDDKFWIRIRNGANSLQDPAANGFKTNTTRGANCANVVFTDKSNPANPAGTLPPAPAGSTDRTLGNWDKVNAANSSVE